MTAKRKYCRKDSPPTFTCPQCEKDFQPLLREYGGRNHGFYYEQKYCSKSCSNSARPKKTWLDQSGYPQRTVNGKGYAIHRDVMEKKLGRKLTRYETVHHRDGDRTNYTEDNLELWSGRHGRGQRVADHVAFAKETLAIYGEGPFDASFIERGRADLAALMIG